MNSYLEKIVDGIVYPIITDYEEIFNKQKAKMLIENESNQNLIKIFNIIVKSINEFKNSSQELNIRLLINLQRYLFNALKKYQLSDFNQEVEEKLLIKFILKFLSNRLNALLLFFRDHSTYSSALNNNISGDITYCAKINNDLKKYNLSIEKLKSECIDRLAPISEKIIDNNFYRELIYYAISSFVHQETLSGKAYLEFIIKSKIANNYIDENYLLISKNHKNIAAHMLMWKIIFYSADSCLSDRVLRMILFPEYFSKIISNINRIENCYYKYWQISHEDIDFESRANGIIKKHVNGYLDMMKKMMNNNIDSFVTTLMENGFYDYIYSNKLYINYFRYVEDYYTDEIICSNVNDEFFDGYDHDYSRLSIILKPLIEFVEKYKKSLNSDAKQINDRIHQFILEHKNYTFSPCFFSNKNVAIDFHSILSERIDEDLLHSYLFEH